MIPYLEHPSLTISGFTIKAFGVMVGLAVLVGLHLVSRRAPRFGIDGDEAHSIALWTVLIGIVISHWFSVIAYFPEELAKNPFVLLNFSSRMSSFGGIVGGIFGAILLMRMRGWSGRKSLQFVDIIAWAFPFAWFFGRLGCTLAHDHIGMASDSFIAVQFPEGARLDLGLIEWLLTIPIAILFLRLDKKPRPTGFYIALFFALYGPIRFGLDFLRVEDITYGGLTPAQYFALLLGAVGLAWSLKLARRPTQHDTAEP